MDHCLQMSDINMLYIKNYNCQKKSYTKDWRTTHPHKSAGEFWGQIYRVHPWKPHMHTHCNHQIRYQKAVSVWKIRRAICLPCGQLQIIKKKTKKKTSHTCACECICVWATVKEQDKWMVKWITLTEFGVILSTQRTWHKSSFKHSHTLPVE